MNQIFLDHNSTTPILPEVVETIRDCHGAHYGNPASQHRSGRRARQALDESREGIARILGAEISGSRPDRVIFTSGGTEANNLAIRGLATHRPGRVIISAIEHPSVIGAAEQLQRQGHDVQRLRVTSAGVVDFDHLRQLLHGPTRLVSIMLGNNETGVLQPVQEAAQICAFAGVPLHTDAVQVVGKLPVDFRGLGAAALSFTAHKLHGPVGVGALIVRPDVQLDPILFGGFQQMGLRPGAEPLVLAAGMYKALQLWQREADERATRMEQLRNRLEALLQADNLEIIINGSQAPRLPHTSNISFLGLDRQALFMALDLAGVACSTGSACASGSSEPSPVLQAMDLPAGVIQSALRISLGALTTPAEIDEGARRILKVAKDLRRSQENRKPAETARQRGRETI